jgi:hypothetical protein
VDLQLGSPRILLRLHVELAPQPTVDEAKGFEVGSAEDNLISRFFGTPDA